MCCESCPALAMGARTAEEAAPCWAKVALGYRESVLGFLELICVVPGTASYRGKSSWDFFKKDLYIYFPASFSMASTQVRPFAGASQHRRLRGCLYMGCGSFSVLLLRFS